MCGIVGAVGSREVAGVLVDALRRLEHEGHDSAGIATLVRGRIKQRHVSGRIDRLADSLEAAPIGGRVGIGHSCRLAHRATNGTQANRHLVGRVAAVLDGIIENGQALRAELKAAGHGFPAGSDAELVSCLVEHLLRQGLPPRRAAVEALGRVEGAFAVVLLFGAREDMLMVAHKGSPLTIGHGEGEMLVGSDAHAVASLTREAQYLEEGDVAIVLPSGVMVLDAAGSAIQRPIPTITRSDATIDERPHRPCMRGGILEQARAVGATIGAFTEPGTGRIQIPDLPFDLGSVTRLAMVACGTASHACLIGRYWIEQLAGLPVDWGIGSEFRYRETPLVAGQVGIFVSRSGEAPDTLAALRLVRSMGHPTLAIVNMLESTLAREADVALEALASPEIGEASTNAFTSQLAVLACLAIGAARARRRLNPAREAALSRALHAIPEQLLQLLDREDEARDIAGAITDARDVLCLGRGPLYPVALEGALKLKETGSVHAEAQAAGELKHGPLALVDEGVPVVVLAPSDSLFDKTASNLQEVVARGGKVVLLSDRRGIAELGGYAWRALEMPGVDPFVAPILYALPVQLLAYHLAMLKGACLRHRPSLAEPLTVE